MEDGPEILPFSKTVESRPAVEKNCEGFCCVNSIDIDVVFAVIGRDCIFIYFFHSGFNRKSSWARLRENYFTPLGICADRLAVSIPTVYFHPGPGLNANPERTLLTPQWPTLAPGAFDWDQPSHQRKDGVEFKEQGAFSQYLQSAELHFLARSNDAPVLLLAHSFGAYAALYMAKKYPERVRTMVLIASAIATEAADQRMFAFTLDDFQAAGSSEYSEMKRVIDNYSGKFDANTETGFRLFLQNPRAFDHYWTDREWMMKYFECMSTEQYAVDINGFFAVRRSLDWSLMPTGVASVKVVSIFGEKEKVVNPAAERAAIDAHFSHHKTHDLPGVGHYPHFERADLVWQLIEESL